MPYSTRYLIQSNMTRIKNMTDIADASHHLDLLRTAEETNTLPRGLVVEPRLVFADKSTADEWKEQTKRNTLGYMKVAMRHYEKLSFYQLSNREIDILSKGLSYIPYNPLTNYVRDSDITNFVRKLRLRYTYGRIPPSDNPIKPQTKRTPGPTDYKPLENIIDRITLTLSQIKRPPQVGLTFQKMECALYRGLKNQHEVIINQGSTIILLDR